MGCRVEQLQRTERKSCYKLWKRTGQRGKVTSSRQDVMWLSKPQAGMSAFTARACGLLERTLPQVVNWMLDQRKKKQNHISEIPSLISFLLSNFQDMRSVAMALCGKIEQRKENTYTLKEVSLSGASWSFRSCVTVLAWWICRAERSYVNWDCHSVTPYEMLYTLRCTGKPPGGGDLDWK